ncbi:helix-turn-helix domain-containing protein [Belliella kenyensis]|uniref:Helix-turn-helix domain-containing protein n=1 Tax=Belliella kenyensis TaxID=1472724 RepID=A0ABV8EPR9_9BACT|nr:helix-turn-helix domain-containing protein [Belliella kenyensis]MCH7400839.1 helix-turn-helix domain-containing protein [Belliella kenyensis]MDN3601873.1 helix-turn-helix domain-containing protein [Belliella kenyensis]
MVNNENEAKLFLAIDEIFGKHGHEELGINKVSSMSGVDKSYIYRKYNSLENLLEKYFMQKDYWSTKVDLLNKVISKNSPFSFNQLVNFYLHKQFDSILTDVQLQKLMLWSISEENELMKKFIAKREEVGNHLFEIAQEQLKNTEIDFRAISAINVAAMYYLSLHASSNNGTFCGLNLNDKEDQEKIKNAVSFINDIFLNDSNHT